MSKEAAVAEISFRWLFNQRSLNLRPVCAPETSFRTIQATELKDPTEFTSQGTLILTLGLAFTDSPAEFSAYARDVAAAGVRGIGFGTGIAFPEVPAELADAALEAGLTLFEIPRETRFLSLTNAVSAELARTENTEHFRLHRQQERLNRAAAGGLQALVEQAAEELQAAVAVCSVQREAPLAAAAGNGTGTAGASARRAALNKASAAARRAATTATSGAHADRRGSTLTATIAKDAAVAATRPEKFAAPARALLRHLTGLAGLLVTQHTPDELGALALAVRTGQSSDTPTERAFATLGPTFSLVALNADNPTHLASARRGLAHPHFWLEVEPTSALVALPAGAQPEFRRSFSQLRVCTATDLRLEHLDAELSRQLLAQARGLALGTSARWGEAGPAWLGSSPVQEALATRRAATLELLSAHDAAHATHLRAAVEAYVRADAHMLSAAQSLGVHRHTLRTRLERAEEVAGLNLSDAVTRAELLLMCVSSPPQP